jgi:hypothetical protein
VLLQVVIVAFEPLHPVFAVVGLRPQEWLGALAVAMLPVPLLEWLKKRARYPSMSSATSQ